MENSFYVFNFETTIGSVIDNILVALNEIKAKNLSHQCKHNEVTGLLDSPNGVDSGIAVIRSFFVNKEANFEPLYYWVFMLHKLYPEKDGTIKRQIYNDMMAYQKNKK